MTAKQEMAYSNSIPMITLLPEKDSSKNKGNTLMLNPLIRVCEQGHVQVLLVFAHIVSEYELAGCVSTFVASCVAVVVSFLWRWAFNFELSGNLRALCSAVWHWYLLAPPCRWALSRFCASWLFSSARRFCSRPFRASRWSWSLRWRSSFVSQATLLGFVQIASEDGVEACTREILVFPHLLHS